jgi:hypothetical protein
MEYYCRDTFLGTKGIIPELDKDALARITHGLRVQYMFDTKNKIGRRGCVDIPEALIDECARRIFAKVIMRRLLQTEDEARRHAARKAMEEAARKAKEEAARKAGEDARRLEEELWNGEVRLHANAKAARKFETVRCSSLAELLAEISRGRDVFSKLSGNLGDPSISAQYISQAAGLLRDVCPTEKKALGAVVLASKTPAELLQRQALFVFVRCFAFVQAMQIPVFAENSALCDTLIAFVVDPWTPMCVPPPLMGQGCGGPKRPGGRVVN